MVDKITGQHLKLNDIQNSKDVLELREIIDYQNSTIEKNKILSTTN